MRRSASLLIVIAVLIAARPVEAQAPEGEDISKTVDALKKHVKALEGRIAELEARQAQEKARQRVTFLELYKELQADARKHSGDLRAYWKDGLHIETEDKRFTAAIGGRLMFDAGWVDGSGIEDDLGVNLEDGVEVRRAWLYAAGTLYKDIDYKLEFEVATGDVQLKSTYLRFKHLRPATDITVGHFNEPFNLEELTSSRYTTFMERSLPNVFTPAKNVGIMANSAVVNERMTWAAGLFRETDAFGEDSADGGYNMTARVTGLPWCEDGGRRLLHLGVAYSLRHPEDPLQYRQRPEAHFIDDRFTDTGEIDADWVNLFGAEAALVYGPFSVQAEYIASAVDSPQTDGCLSGFYVQASYFLTGEHRPYNTSCAEFGRVRPKRNFGEDGWGAWELAARYSYVDLDDSSLPDTARTVQDATLGLNWYMNPNVRVMWNYIRSCVDGRDTSNAADILMMRMQVDF